MKSSELAHEALMVYRYAQKDMQRLADKIATLRAKSFYQGSGIVRFDGGGNRSLDPMGDKWRALLDLEKEYNDMYLASEQKCLEIDKRINRIKDHLERIVLNMYYCQLKSNRDIAKILNYSQSHIDHIKSEALESYAIMHVITEFAA